MFYLCILHGWLDEVATVVHGNRDKAHHLKYGCAITADTYTLDYHKAPFISGTVHLIVHP